MIKIIFTQLNKNILHRFWKW